MGDLTPRARLLLSLGHQEPDRVPLHYRATEPGLKRLVDGAGLDPEVRNRFLSGDVDLVAFRGPVNDGTPFLDHASRSASRYDVRPANGRTSLKAQGSVSQYQNGWVFWR